MVGGYAHIGSMGAGRMAAYGYSGAGSLPEEAGRPGEALAEAPAVRPLLWYGAAANC